MKKKVSIIPAITREQLRIQVERLVHGDGLSYTEALIEICEKKEIDPEDIAKIVKGPLKNKLEVEAVNRNIIKSDTAELY